MYVTLFILSFKNTLNLIKMQVTQFLKNIVHFFTSDDCSVIITALYESSCNTYTREIFHHTILKYHFLRIKIVFWRVVFWLWFKNSSAWMHLTSVNITKPFKLFFLLALKYTVTEIAQFFFRFSVSTFYVLPFFISWKRRRYLYLMSFLS